MERAGAARSAARTRCERLTRAHLHGARAAPLAVFMGGNKEAAAGGTMCYKRVLMDEYAQPDGRRAVKRSRVKCPKGLSTRRFSAGRGGAGMLLVGLALCRALVPLRDERLANPKHSDRHSR